MSVNYNFYGSGMSFYDNPTTGQNFYDMTFDVTSAANRPAPTSPAFLVFNEGRAWYLRSLCSTSQTPYYFDPVNGSDSNDGRDGVVKASSTSFSWTESTKTLTKAGAFASYTFQKGDQIYIASGTGATPGLYTIASKTSNNAVVLTTSLSSGAVDLGAVITVSTGPKQTGTAMNTLLAAGNCRILGKRGTTMSFATGLTFGGSNVSAATYGTGPQFRLDTGPVVQVSGGTFTIAAGKTYTYKMTRSGASLVSGVREQNSKDRWYARVSSINECEALPGSFFHDTAGNLLYIHNYYNFDLTSGTTPVYHEIFPTNGVNGCLVTSPTSVRIDGWDVVGFGALDTNTQNSCYSFHSEMGLNNIFCCVDCDGSLANNHNFGQTAGNTGTGGILVCFSCRAHGMTFVGDPFVAYASAGAQEMYLVDCEVLSGNLLRIVAGVPNYLYGASLVGFALMHTDGGAAKSGYGVNIRGVVREGMMQAASLFAIANTDATTSDPTAIKGWNIDCVFNAWRPTAKDNLILADAANEMGTCPFQIAGGNPVDGFTTGYINCSIESRAQFCGSSQNEVYCMDKFEGLHINGRYDFDFSQIQSPDRAALSAGIVQTAVNLNASLYNCHVRIRGSGAYGSGQGIGWVAYNVYGNNSFSLANEVPIKFSWFDSILTIDAERPTQAFFGCGNNRQKGSVIGDAGGAKWSPSRSVNIATNVPYSTDVYRGNDQTDNLVSIPNWNIGKRPKLAEIDAVQTPLMGSAYYVGYDRNWTPRRAGTTAIGPVEAVG